MRKRETLRFFAIASETRREHLASESRLAGRRYVSLCYGQPPEYRHLRDDSVNCATGSHDGPCAHTAPPKPAAALRSSRQRLPALKRLRRLGYKQINIAKYSVQVGSSQAAGWLKSVHRSPNPQAASQPPTLQQPVSTTSRWWRIIFCSFTGACSLSLSLSPISTLRLLPQLRGIGNPPDQGQKSRATSFRLGGALLLRQIHIVFFVSICEKYLLANPPPFSRLSSPVTVWSKIATAAVPGSPLDVIWRRHLIYF